MRRTERDELEAILAAFENGVALASTVRFLAQHPPISQSFTLATIADALERIDAVRESGDLQVAAPLTKLVLFDGRKKWQPAHEAADRLRQHYKRAQTYADLVRLERTQQDLHGLFERERQDLDSLLRRGDELRKLARSLEFDVQHMPISRSGVLDPTSSETVQRFSRAFDEYAPDAKTLAGPAKPCVGGTCSAAHRAVQALASHWTSEHTWVDDQALTRIRNRIREQQHAERAQVATLLRQSKSWQSRVQSILTARQQADNDIQEDLTSLIAAGAHIATTPPRMVLPLQWANQQLLERLVLLRDFHLEPGDHAKLSAIDQFVWRQLPELEQRLHEDGTCERSSACLHVHDTMASYLAEAKAFETTLLQLAPMRPIGRLTLDNLLEQSLGVEQRLPSEAASIELISSALTTQLKAKIESILAIAANAASAPKAVTAAAERVRQNDVERALRAMDLEVLRQASPEQVRVAALASANLNTVWDVVHYTQKRHLRDLAGLGDTTARTIAQAARRLFEAVREETPVRIDVRQRDEQTTTLLITLRRWHALRSNQPSADEMLLLSGVQQVFSASPATTHLLTYATQSALDAEPAHALLERALSRVAATEPEGDVWEDFLSRPSDYFGMLTELGFVTEDEKKMHGDLPEDIIEAVRAKELRRDFLTASLRTYQSFAARFALVQEQVLIGDEMGLGKTVEALAVLAHLQANGHSHFLVVCPAAVVSNWIRETKKHTSLKATRLHGPEFERRYALRMWARAGGVGVTTYDLLAWTMGHLGDIAPGCAVFDEAHFIKNPNAKRSLAAAELISTTPYTVLMTGTPLENNVQEFRNLINYLRPDLADSAPDYLASRFRRHVAPAYLRRNQEDVLTELPELVEIDEWLPMSEADIAQYEPAVAAGNFMAMRQAAMLSSQSVKLARLREIVEEAEANGRRVIVFSYFREVLNVVHDHLPGRVFGPITGSVPAIERQNIIDRFSQADHGAVLVAQVTAGGVGLNIQAASVVIICEPQVKPTLESQAIARAHRMGQTHTVQVHRLLTEDSVDERIRDILADKRRLFDDFARDSVIAAAAPEAVDMTDSELAHRVIAAERERLFGQAES